MNTSTPSNQPSDGLFPVGRPTPLGTYLRDLWARRDYIVRVPLNELRSQNAHTLLGGIWLVLNPLLQVGVYFGDSGKALGESVDAGDVSPGTSCTADLSKIRDKRVAFTSESSTSGYLFPALQLIEAGIDPVKDIIPIFTGGHDAAVVAVYNGDADVGVSYDDARRSLRKEKTDVGEKVIVFNITSEVPNDVVAASTLLPASLRTAIYDAIDAYLDTEEGEAVFDETYGWTSIRRAVESDFDVVRKAAEALGITEPVG